MNYQVAVVNAGRVSVSLHRIIIFHTETRTESLRSDKALSGDTVGVV